MYSKFKEFEEHIKIDGKIVEKKLKSELGICNNV